MCRVAEHVAGGLVYRHGAGPGRRVGYGSGVNLAGLETPVGHVHGLLAFRRPATGLKTSLSVRR